MKTLLIILFSACAFALQAQSISPDQIPAEVRNAVKTKFPDAADLKWEAKTDQYKAEFKIGKRGHDVWLDKKGVIKKHKQDFPKSELPEVIRKKIETDFSGYKIDDADKIEENSVIFYEVDLEGPADDRKLRFTSAGEMKENKVKESKKD
jgi:hypothetical protein